MIIGQLLSQIKSNTLIQKAQGITHGTVCFLCNITDGSFFHFHAFLLHQFHKPAADGIDGNPFKVITLASGQDRDRNLVCLCCSQDKDHIRGRLFQCFQKSVERSDGKHMHLIDDIDLIFSCGR